MVSIQPDCTLESMNVLLSLLQSGDHTKMELVESYALIPHLFAKMKSSGPSSETSALCTKLLTAIFDETIKHESWSIALPLRQLEKAKALSGTAKPHMKEMALTILEKSARECPKAFANEIEWAIHPVVLLMNDVHKGVKSIAKEALKSIINACGNADLLDGTENFVDTIVKSIESLKMVEPGVEKLAGCVFVQSVEAPHLSVMTPIFWRGLKSKSQATQRRCCVIIENMCNVVEDPREGRPLFGETLSLVTHAADSLSDPDAREMADKTLKMLNKLKSTPERAEIDILEVIGSVDGPARDKLTTAGNEESTTESPNIHYLQTITNILAKANIKGIEAWEQVLCPFVDRECAQKVMDSILEAGKIKEIEFFDDDSAPDLYRGCFSLAFGTIGLLREAKLHLKRGKFYAILGPNNCGKSTLLKSIAQEKLEGFPKRDELVTIYVCHDVEPRELEPPSEKWPEGKTNLDLTGIEYCVDTVNNVYGKKPAISLEQAEEALGGVGFKNMVEGVNVDSPADMLRPITDYSGGWKMKMQLACAKLIDADILTLDEPTGQLDVNNIEWMKNWLNSFPGSIMAASTNASFLDEMCTGIICFEDRKLRQFKSEKGRVLKDFVTQNPEKQAYFELTNRFQSFVFPKPGVLEGVKSRGRAVLKMNGVDFKYSIPGSEAASQVVKNTVSNITLSVCMASRISVVGSNGAGKSTAIKLLIGELKPGQGTIFRHPGMRLAYVAQHSLKHLKAHLNKTPCEYILWRFQGNDDRESLENRTKEINSDEAALREVGWCIDPKSGSVRKLDIGEKTKPVKPESILNRKKNKAKKFEYEVKWMYQPVEDTTWVEGDTIRAMGYEKLVSVEDEKQAAAAGLLARPLIAVEVEKALKDFGVDSEAASHNPIHSLSDGQMFRVVLTAAMWQCPHILILDEPTNYLDRDGIGALTSGLQDFEGGVVIISHDAEFAETVCPEQKWVMKAGELKEVGCEIENVVGKEGDEAMVIGDKRPDEIVTANGEIIKVQKALTEKERKKVIKDIEKKLKENKKKNTLSEAEMWTLQDELEAHKNCL